MLNSAEVAEIKAALAMAQTDIPGLTHSVFLKMADRATHLIYTTVGHVLKIDGLVLEGKKQDVTSHLSGGWMENKNVLKDGGKMSFKVHFLGTTNSGVYSESESTLNLTTGLGAAALQQTVEYFQVTYVDGSSPQVPGPISALQFTAFVSVAFEAPVNSRLVGRVVLDLTGPVTVLP
ncbi:MAG: hypothetical protein WCK35_16770 [Chloroflexota bacterium]